MALKTKRYIAGTAPAAATGTLPFAITKTGTVSSVGTVVTGTGTLFTTELVQSDYLYNAATNEVRKITGIQSNTILRIDTAFTSPLSAVAVQTSRAQFVSVAITATGAGTKDGVAMTSGQNISINNDAGISPFTYSGSLTFDVGYNE